MAEPTGPQPWSMTQKAFDLLLSQLDSDRDAAGERYQRIRDKLVNFFRWRGCANADDYADRTIDRGARRLEEGAEITARDPYLYFHGVALNVLREHWKKAEKENTQSLDALPVWQTPAAEPDVGKAQEIETQEARVGCLHHCVEILPRPQLDLITQYHQGEGGARIARRNELALSLSIPLNALRIRAFRIRGELEKCVVNCVSEKIG